MASIPSDAPAATAAAGRPVSLFHIYALRVVFFLMAAFLLSSVAPLLASPAPNMMTGAARALFVALGLLAALGVRYPVQMLPVMLFELVWKLLWLAFIGLPLWMADRLDAPHEDTFINVTVGIPLVLIALPWGYVWRNYVVRPGDHWRSRTSG